MRRLSAWIVVGLLVVAPQAAQAFGALAVDGNRGTKFGSASDQASADVARDAAIASCGPGCRSVIIFQNTCAAFATDTARDDGATGWSGGRSVEEAKREAEASCRRFGGTTCLARVWACEVPRGPVSVAKDTGAPALAAGPAGPASVAAALGQAALRPSAAPVQQGRPNANSDALSRASMSGAARARMNAAPAAPALPPPPQMQAPMQASPAVVVLPPAPRTQAPPPVQASPAVAALPPTPAPAVAPAPPLAAPDAGRRVALVIGNDDYQSLDRLRKAVNDSRAVGDTLARLGFEVVRAENAPRRTMNQKLVEFANKIGRGDTAFFFYAGHGVEIKSVNYLLPIDAPAAREGEEGLITAEGIPADTVIERLQERGARVSILVLDACRENPFKKPGTRGIGGTRGLTRMQTTEGVFLLYSAGIGQTALDRLSDTDTNPNSVFTRSLVKNLGRPGQSIQELAKTTQAEVRRLAGTVNHPQMPAYYDEILGLYTLVPGR